MKINVEEMELEALRGAIGILSLVNYIIAETSVRRHHKDSYGLADHGFHLYDALWLMRTKALAPGASIMDAVFVNERLPTA